MQQSRSIGPLAVFALLAVGALAPVAHAEVLDSTPPSTPYVQSGLAPDAYLRSGWPVRITAHDSDSGIVRAWIEDAADGSELLSVDVDATGELDEMIALVAPAATGPRAFRIVVQDAAGNRSSVERTYLFDADLPTATGPTLDGAAFVDGSDVPGVDAPQLCWQVGDATTPVRQVVAMLDGRVVDAVLSGDHGCIAAHVALAPGAHTANLVVIDGVGLNGRSERVRFSTSEPEPVVVADPEPDPTLEPGPAPDTAPVSVSATTDTPARPDEAVGAAAAQPSKSGAVTSAPAVSTRPESSTRYRIVVRQRAAGAVRRTGRITLRLWASQRATVQLRADGTSATRTFGVRATGRSVELRAARGSRLAQRLRAARPGQLLTLRLRVTVLGGSSARAARPHWILVRVRA